MTDGATNHGGRGWSGWRIAVWGGAAALLLTPLAAMRLTDAVRWTGSDFAIFAVMLAVPLGVLELAVRTTSSLAYRAATIVALGAAFLMTWANLAVGLVGGEGDPLNLMVFGVLLVGVVGAVVARFRPKGMAYALAAMAVAQVLAALAVLANGHVEALLVGVFAAAWLLSAWLFWKAAADQPRTRPER